METLGIIGFGRIGQEVAKIGLGCGMKIIASDTFLEKATIEFVFFDGQKVDFEIKSQSFEKVLKESDFISVHVPAQKNYIFSKKEFSLMKDGAAIVNAGRGGVIDEVALIEAIESNKLSFAAIDTFENEPSPAIQILMNGKLSLTPHIGAATNEAQDRIGTELAEQIKSILKP